MSDDAERITVLELRCNALEKAQTAFEKDYLRRVEWEPYLWVLRALIVAALTTLLTGVLAQPIRNLLRGTP